MKRILVKLSGEALRGGSEDILSKDNVQSVVDQIITLSKEYQVGIVVGGGNIWRGAVGVDIGMYRSAADYMGMLATMMNGLALQSIMLKRGVKTHMFSAVEARKIASPHIVRDAHYALENGEICIFTGGTGAPYFTTDTTSALRAAEIGAETILMAKNGVDGIYNKDPKTNNDATRFDNLTYDEVISKNLKVMDQTALTLCKDNNIEIRVFNMLEENALLRAVENDIKMTKVK